MMMMMMMMMMINVTGSDRAPALLRLSQNGYGGLVRRLLSGLGILTFNMEGFYIHTRKRCHRVR